MMHTKKLVAVPSFIIALGVLFIACRLATPMPQTLETTAVPTAGPTREAGGLMCVIVPDVEDPYHRTPQEVAARKAEELGYTTLKLVHDDDPRKEGELIDNCIAQQAVAIILNPAGVDVSVPAIQKAKDAGVPTFLIDREINLTDVAFSQIVSNNYQGSVLLAEEFVRLMGEEGEYIELLGRDTDTGAGPIYTQGFHQVLDDFPDLEMVAQQYAGLTSTEVFDVMERLLLDHPNVKGVICGDSYIALGAQAALNDADRTDVIVAGFGGSAEVKESIMNGEIDAGVLPPIVEMTEEAVIQADQYIRTGSTGQPEKQAIDMTLLTPENACHYTGFAPNGRTGSCTAAAGDLMCIIVPEVESPYFRAQQEIAAVKAKELGYTVLTPVHNDDPTKESELIDLCIARQAVAIILNPARADASIAAIQKAKGAGVPTFLIDREINQIGVAVSLIISNNYQGGFLLAEEFVRLMGEEGEYIELVGELTDSSADLIYSQGFHAVLDDYADLKMVAQRSANWSQAEAFDVIEHLLPEHPNVKGVICGNVSMALGAQAALKAAGMDNVIVAGLGGSRGVDFDGSDDLTRSIMYGGIDAGGLQPVAEIATQAVIQADQYIRTGSTGQPERQAIDMTLLTPENACMYTAFAPNGKTSCP